MSLKQEYAMYKNETRRVCFCGNTGEILEKVKKRGAMTVEEAEAFTPRREPF